MKTIFAVITVILGLGGLTMLAGCGGSSGGGTCAAATACGGNIVGSWKVRSSCVTVDASMFVADCPTATANSTGLKITGTATYNADLTYTDVASLTGTVVVNIPGACIPAGTTCADGQAALEADPTFSSATCVASGGGCACTVGFSPGSSTDTGTYTTTAAGLLTETSAGQTSGDESDYCVKGTTLTESPHDGSPMMGGTVSGSITFTKQ